MIVGRVSRQMISLRSPEPGSRALSCRDPVEATVEHRGKTTTARRCFLASAALDAKTFAAVRAH